MGVRTQADEELDEVGQKLNEAISMLVRVWGNNRKDYRPDYQKKIAEALNKICDAELLLDR